MDVFMKQKGNNILVKPLPSEKISPSGIIYPDTVSPKSQRIGEVLEGNSIPKGSKVWYLSRNCPTRGEESLVSNKKVLYWV